MNAQLAVLACLLAVGYAMTTHKPHHHNTGHTHAHGHGHHTHPSRAPPIGEAFTFTYDKNAHRMLIISAHQCYVFRPSDTEIMTIQSDVHALRALEIKLIQLIDNNPTPMTMTHDDLSLMSTSLGHKCKPSYPIMVLN